MVDWFSWFKEPPQQNQKTDKPDLSFISCEKLRSNPKFLYFLAFGFLPDEKRARCAIERLVAAKTEAPEIFRSAWIEASPAERYAAMDRLLSEVIQEELTKARLSDRPIVVGLSGGFDSRLILHYLRRNDAQFSVYTFPNEFDAEAAEELSRRLDFDIERVPGVWDIESLYVRASVERDVAFLERSAAVVHISTALPRRIEFHGYYGDALTGAHVKMPVSGNWQDAGRRFARKNNAFGLSKRLRSWELLPAEPLIDANLVDFDTQLDFAYRQELRIKPGDADETYRFPLADPRWVGVWMNRSEDDRFGQRLYIDFVRSLKAPEFWDVNQSPAPLSAEVRADQASLYNSAPVDRSGLVRLRETAMRNLLRRGVFSREFLEFTFSKDVSQKSSARLICSTEIAIGAGWFDE